MWLIPLFKSCNITNNFQFEMTDLRRPIRGNHTSREFIFLRKFREIGSSFIKRLFEPLCS